MENVIYRNRPRYNTAPPTEWMLHNVWGWSELQFTFETATVLHTQDVSAGWYSSDFAFVDEVEASFNETFDLHD